MCDVCVHVCVCVVGGWVCGVHVCVVWVGGWGCVHVCVGGWVGGGGLSVCVCVHHVWVWVSVCARMHVQTNLKFSSALFLLI